MKSHTLCWRNVYALFWSMYPEAGFSLVMGLPNTHNIYSRRSCIELIQHPHMSHDTECTCSLHRELTKVYTHTTHPAPSHCSNLLVRCIYSSRWRKGKTPRLCTRRNSLYHRNCHRRHRYMRRGPASNRRPALLSEWRMMNPLCRHNVYALSCPRRLEPIVCS